MKGVSKIKNNCSARSNHWERSSQTLLGFRLLQHRKTHEWNLVCRYGEIWDDSGNKCRAVVTNYRLANRISQLLKLNRKYAKGDEAVFTLEGTELLKVVFMLKPIQQFRRAIELAETRFSQVKAPSDKDLKFEISRQQQEISRLAPKMKNKVIWASNTGGLEEIKDNSRGLSDSDRSQKGEL